MPVGSLATPKPVEAWNGVFAADLAKQTEWCGCIIARCFWFPSSIITDIDYTIFMNRIPEFVGNHPILFLALAVVIGMIAFFEYQRLFSGIKQLSPIEATRLQNDDDAIFIDVREDTEFKRGHVLGARHIPISTFDKRITELEKSKDKPLIVYCANGARAGRAAGKLRKAEYPSVYTMAGGIVGWEKANMPISTKS